jgi:hypothetical protein
VNHTELWVGSSATAPNQNLQASAQLGQHASAW